MCNERPLGVNRSPTSDGSYQILTPNCLLLGRAQNCLPDDENITGEMKKTDRYELVQQVTRDFWNRWVTEVTPLHVIRQKWHSTGRNLVAGDIVLVHDKTSFKGKYRIAKVTEVKVSTDGMVRSCLVVYRIPNAKDLPHQYSGGKLVTLSRSVQRLTLLLAKEDQETELEVDDNGEVRKSESGLVKR